MNLELTPAALLSCIHTQLHSLAHPQHLKLKPIKKILIAYSGGLDSHVLLHLFSRIPRDEFDLRAVYINHGLQVEAKDWGNHCKNICQDLGLTFTSIDLNLAFPKGESIEEVARNGRYNSLCAELGEDEILVTGHHQNDQAETLLLQLFRGAGVQGLAAMPMIGEIKRGGKTHFHFRPLLHQSKQSMEAYARINDLKHIEDSSNHDTSFDRNFLRQEIMPLLRQRWLGIDKAISRAAAHQAETKILLDDIAQQELPSILASSLNYFYNDESHSLPLAPISIYELVKHNKNKQHHLLRYWISKQGFSMPSTNKLQHIFSDLIESADDKQPLIKWKDAELRRYQQHLFIMSPLSDHDATQIIHWTADNPLQITSIERTLNPEIIETDKKDISVRFRQGGETIEIPKRGNISLKNLFQENKIPPWIRPRLPLIYRGNKLVKVVGIL